jgi:hypothetical protein
MGGPAGDTLAILEVVPVGGVQARPANAAGALGLAASGSCTTGLAGAVRHHPPTYVCILEA